MLLLAKLDGFGLSSGLVNHWWLAKLSRAKHSRDTVCDFKNLFDYFTSHVILKDLEICEVASESQASTGLNICNDTQREKSSDFNTAV